VSGEAYGQVEKLVSGIRNAKYDDMVRQLEELIDSGLWQDFTTPDGTRFQFRSHELDYFLAAMSLDPELIKHAYTAASGRLEGMHVKQVRLADITGRGEPTTDNQRRSRKEVVEAYADEPSGTGARIRAFGNVVTAGMSKVARDPERREQYKAGARVNRYSRGASSWHVHAGPGQRLDQAVALKLLRDPELWPGVLKLLRAEHDHQRMSTDALGDNPDRGQLLLRDVLAVFGDVAFRPWRDLAEILSIRFPERWTGLTADFLSADCRAHGVPSVRVSPGNGAATKTRGCSREDVERVVRGE
jgi:hypothetical protein